MGLVYSGIDFQIREVDLKHKPRAMLDISPKATVPVLLVSSQLVIEESLDILLWSLHKNDPEGWREYPKETLMQMVKLVDENDIFFKEHLDHYKYSDRYPDETMQSSREQGEVFLAKLESRLSETTFLFGERVSYADVAIFSFIRQFSNVEPRWFQSAPYPHLRKWLARFLESHLFESIMKKYKPWQESGQN
jgi:glutathione S-transferase